MVPSASPFTPLAPPKAGGSGTRSDTCADARSRPPRSPVISHPLLVGTALERRLYQEAIAAECVKSPTLVVLPTGLGKTVIALQVILKALDHGKALFMAPTKPLAEQHYNFLRAHLRTPDDVTDATKAKARAGAKGSGSGNGNGNGNDGAGEKEPTVSIALFTGAVPPAKREALYASTRLLVATPQVIENDILSQRLRLNDFSLVVYDEAHRAVGNYAYVFVAEIHRAARSGSAPEEPGTIEKGTGDGTDPGDDGEWKALALGMTASPGSRKEQILKVCGNLGLSHIEKRSDFDIDVIRYIQPIRTHWITVELPERLKQVREELKLASGEALKRLHGWGLLPRPRMISTKMLLDCGRAIEHRLHSSAGKPQAYLYQARSLQAMALKLGHAQEVAETQGLEQLLDYFAKLDSEIRVGRPSRATKKMATNAHVKRAARLARESNIDHPKLTRLNRLISHLFDDKPQSKFIIFANYRVTAELIVARLSKIEGARPVRFVGQGRRDGDKGLTQKEQKEILEAFRQGEHNLLVATSVGEEGLDIPSTDGVIFYEPVPSAIRLIQRRGRTGRNRPGAVYIMLTKDSRDEAYYWASRNREKQMRSLLQNGFPAAELVLDLPSEAELRDIARQSARVRAGTDGNGRPSAEGSTTAPTPAPAQAPEAKSDPSASTTAPRPSPPGPTDGSPTELPDPTRRPGTAGPSTGETGPAMWKRPRDTGTTRAPGPASGPAPAPAAPGGQASLGDFRTGVPPPEPQEPLTMVMDHREMASGLARELHRKGIRLTAEQLPVGDFLISANVGVERKTTEDFLGSLIEGKLFGQVRALAAAFPKPLLLLEGSDLFTRRQIDSEAIYGVLATISTDFGVPILSTANERESAAMLTALVIREARRGDRKGRPVPIRGSKPGLSPAERQSFIVEGLPGVSAALAVRLLDHFGSVRELFVADEAGLKEVDGIGPRKAQAILEVIGRPWVARRK